MPKKHKYRPNRQHEPLFDWDFTVMEILREKPKEDSSSPLETSINGDDSECSDVKETEPQVNINQSTNDDLLDVTEPSLDNLSQDVLYFINCLRESNASLRQDVRTLKEDTLQMQHLMELSEKREECTQPSEDLDRFDDALKESEVKVSLLECDVDFYKQEVESLEKTINELKVAQNGGSTEQKTSCLGQSDPSKPSKNPFPERTLTIFLVPSAPSIPSKDVSSIPSVDTSATSVDSKPEPSLDVRSTPSLDAKSSSLVKSGSVPSPSCVLKTEIYTQSLARIPKLDLSYITDFDAELTEPIRTRETSLPSIAKSGAESFSKGKTTITKSLLRNHTVYKNKTEVGEPIRASGVEMLQRTKATPDEREPLSFPKLDLLKIYRGPNP